MPQKTTVSTPLRILIVEDMPHDAELICAELERAGFSQATTIRAETLEQFLQQIATPPDVILCDYALPNFGAPEALRILQERRQDIPFIIVSGSIGEETAVEAIKQGADDYLLKDRLGRLGSAILQALEEKRLRLAAQRAEEDLRQSEFKYRCLFDHLPDAAYLCDATNGRIIDTNQSGERMLGLERAVILGSRLEQYVPTPISRVLLARTEFSGAPFPALLTEVTDRSGRTQPVQITATAVSIHKRRLMLTFFRAINGEPIAPTGKV
jgi:PAS domain S-box-containing protein